MSAIQFVLAYPDGRSEQLRIEGGRAVVGSAAHCEVRLPSELAESEILLVELHSGQVFARALSAAQVSLDGVLFREGPVSPESVLRFGPVQLRVAVEAKEVHAARTAKPSERNPRVYVLAALVAVALGYVLSHRTNELPSLTIPAEVPPLWAGDAEKCTEASAGTALARATELEILANGKRERSPFFARDGISAVQMYREAAACRRSAADAPSAALDERDAASLAQRMQDEYHLARLRLERALVSRDFDAANVQVRLLKDMLQGKTGEYVAFLSLIERHLLIKSSASKVGAS